MKAWKPDKNLFPAMFLIIFAIVFYALVNHLSIVWDALWFLADLIEPLIIGGILAFFMSVPLGALERLCCRVRRKKELGKVSSMLCLAVTYVGMFLLIFLILYILIPQVASTFPSIAASVETAMPRFLQFLESHAINSEAVQGLLAKLDIQVLLDDLIANYQTVLSTSFTAVTSVVEVLMLAISGFVISIYILANKKKMTRQCKKLLYAYLRKPAADRVVEIAVLSNRTFTNFLSGQCVESLILGSMFFVTMSILRLHFAPVISVFIAFTALIPYVGAFLGCVVGLLLIVTVSPLEALIFLGVFLVLQQLEEQLIYPRVVGSSVGLSPLWILVSVFVGGKLAGIIGMLFFIPLASILYTLLQTNVNHRLSRKNLEVHSDHVERAEKQEKE